MLWSFLGARRGGFVLLGRGLHYRYTAIAAVSTAAEFYWVGLGNEAPLDIFGPLLLAPVLLISGVLSLLPVAVGAVKSLPEP